MTRPPAFERHIGIDYAGTKTPNDRLKGLRVYLAQGDGPAQEVPPAPGRRGFSQAANRSGANGLMRFISALLAFSACQRS